MEWIRARFGWGPVVSRLVIVNLTSGRAVEGVLVRQSGGLLFLRNATAHEPGAAPEPMQGEAIIPRASVDFIQAV